MRRAIIKAVKVDGGYRMVAVLPDGTEELPQEGRVHTSRQSIYQDARVMYNNTVWDWRDRDHSIKID